MACSQGRSLAEPDMSWALETWGADFRPSLDCLAWGPPTGREMGGKWTPSICT